jgi:hypothetical protein
MDVAVFAGDSAQIFRLREKRVRARRTADQLANDAALGQNPIVLAWDKPASGNTANKNAIRLSISRRSEKGIPRQELHRPARYGLDRNACRITSELEDADVTFKTGNLDVSQLSAEFYPS